MSDDTPLSADGLMAEVMARVRRRLLDTPGEAGSVADRPASEDIDAAVALMQRALDGRRRLMVTPLVLDDEDWTLRTSLHLQSHRPRIGGLLVGVKRRVLLPVFRWLYDYSRDNFVQQQQVNTTLMACVETLMVEVVRLRRELDARRSPAGSAPDGRSPQ